MKTRKMKILLPLFVLFLTCTGCYDGIGLTVLGMPEEEPSWTPLHRAVVKGDLKGDLTEIQLLIDEGADVNAKERKRGQTPLHFAALLGDTEIFELLRENGAKLNVEDSNENSPLVILSIIKGLEEESNKIAKIAPPIAPPIIPLIAPP